MNYPSAAGRTVSRHAPRSIHSDVANDHAFTTTTRTGRVSAFAGPDGVAVGARAPGRAP